MDRVRATITKNLEEHPEFAEYFKILAVIETHELINPDICIESCRCLIEGICKTIIIRLDPAKNAENTGGHFPNLFSRARQLLIENCAEIEGDIVIIKYGAIIELLNKTRNDRGDISHGRAAPKQKYSSPVLASMLKGMTDTVLTFMLEHYFNLEFSASEKLDYEDEEMTDYNVWLDDQTDFPIQTVSYSHILFEHDYDAYETRYYDEFILTLEGDNDVEPVGEPESKLPAPIDEPHNKITEPIGEPDIKLPEPVDVPEIPPLEPVGEPETRTDDLPISPPETEPVDSELEAIPVIWTDDQEATLVALVDDMGLKLPFARQVVQLYLFDGRPPLTDEIIKTLPQKPRLKERRAVVEATTKRLVDLAKQLQPGPAAEE